MAQIFKKIFIFSGWTFKIISKIVRVFAAILQNVGEIYNFFDTRNAILMTTSCVFISSNHAWIGH